MITRIDHIGIAVSTLERRLPFWAELLGLEVSGMETVDSEQVKVAMLPAGESRIELLEATAADSTVARFIERRGEGLHHLTFGVSDLDAMLERLRLRGVELLGGGARPGAGGASVAFIHPRSTGGVLVELVETGPAAATVDPGACVLLYLHDPTEKLWGVLRRLDATGVVLEGIDLSSFDDWVAQVEQRDERAAGPSVLFVPMGRLDKILLDRPSGSLPSMMQRFEQRTGKTVEQALREEQGPR